MLRIAFMPIKPIYADKIIEGSKRFEFRKVSIKHDLTHLVIYASSPVKRIIGVAVVEGVEISRPLETWGLTKHAAGISQEDFFEYFEGKDKAVTIKLQQVMPLDRGVCPKEIESDFKVPQSFKYVAPDFLQDVIEKGGLLAA